MRVDGVETGDQFVASDVADDADVVTVGDGGAGSGPHLEPFAVPCGTCATTRRRTRGSHGVNGAATTAWTAGEATSFLAAVRGERWYPMWRLVLATGLRRGEVLGLRW